MNIEVQLRTKKKESFIGISCFTNSEIEITDNYQCKLCMCLSQVVFRVFVLYVCLTNGSKQRLTDMICFYQRKKKTT